MRVVMGSTFESSPEQGQTEDKHCSYVQFFAEFFIESVKLMLFQIFCGPLLSKLEDFFCKLAV